MIITQIVGGLGNQMFQYAFGRSLAIKHSQELKLDLTAFQNYRLHRYGLNNLAINSTPAVENEIKSATAATLLERLADKARPAYARKRLIEPYFHFAPEFLDKSNPAYLQGYWQSEKYFSEVAPTIRKELSVRVAPDEKNSALLEKIRNENAVSLHVRRGDYAANPEMNKVHGTCSMDYYQRAIETMREAVGAMTLFVFSDDPVWVRNNMDVQNNNAVFVDINGPDKNYEDLRLMYSCNHHIIANSTFSWWGAWLNGKSNKKVLAPKRWFVDSAVDTSDILPPQWIRL